jgi:hypothetical protein
MVEEEELLTGGTFLRLETITTGLFTEVDEFACHSAACRPTSSGGSGGSDTGGGKKWGQHTTSEMARIGWGGDSPYEDREDYQQAYKQAWRREDYQQAYKQAWRREQKRATPPLTAGGPVETFALGEFTEVDEFECHDASCRPPTSGGTGGSSKGQTRGATGGEIEVSRGSKGKGTVGTRDFGIDGLTPTGRQQLVEHFQTAVPGGQHVTTPEEAVQVTIDHLKATVDMAIEAGYTPEMAQSAAHWYDVANTESHLMATDAGLNHHETAAAVLAALSPSAAWESNLHNGKQVCDYVGKNPEMTDTHAQYAQYRAVRALQSKRDALKKDGQDLTEVDKAIAEAERPETLASYQKMMVGKRFNDLPDKLAVMVLQGDTQFNGSKGISLIPHPDGSYDKRLDSGKAIIQSNSNMLKAIKIAKADKNGASVEEMSKVISANVSGQSKVRAFYMNIAYPNDTAQRAITADTHFFSASVGLPLNATSAKPYFTSTTEVGFARGYPANQAALQAMIPYLAQKLGVSPEALPRSAQSVLWEMERYLVPEKAKGDFIKNPEKMAELERLYNEGKALEAKRYYYEQSGAAAKHRVKE